jgi:AcrR family transcriptional regulator
MTKPKNTKTSRPYGGISHTERKVQRKEQFLQAGLREFGRNGFRSATVRRVCKEAKLTDRYFYESYGKLENLLKAVYEDCMTSLSKQILDALTSEYAKSNAENAIIAGLDRYFEVLEDPLIARICMVELEGINPQVDTLYYHYINGFADILVALANHAFPDMAIAKEQQDIIAMSLVGAMRQSATNWLMNDYDTDRAVLVNATSQLFLGIITLMKQN